MSRIALGLLCAGCALLAVLPGFRRASSPTGAAGADSPTLALAASFTDDALGVVGDVASDRQGRLYVLDVQRQTVVVRSPAQPQTMRLGQPGRGPGEFIAPIALALSPDGRLLVLDAGTMRVQVFRTGADGPRPAGSIPLPFPAEDIVECGGRVFLLGSWAFNMIHEISPINGEILRSFAPDAVAPDDLMAGYRSSGYLECGPGPALTFLPMLRPELRRFSLTTGAESGRLEIPRYVQVHVEQRPDGGLMFQAPENGHDRASSLVTLADGRQLVQVGTLREGARTRHEFPEVRSFLVSWDESSIVPAPHPLPRILRAAGDSVYVVETDPVPSVRAAQIRFDEKERNR
jgi:hypothetical protein